MVSLTEDRRVYARALALVAEIGCSPAVVALAAADGHALRRIRRILAGSSKTSALSHLGWEPVYSLRSF